MKYFFLFALLASNAYCLEHYEELPAKILKIKKNNIIVLNRGREDGVRLHDHIKLVTNSDGFSSRAFAIKASLKKSEWKLFRVINPEKISKDLDYKIISLSPTPLPPSYRHLKNKSKKKKKKKKSFFSFF